jgi:acetyl-CoA carboxylase biotin carboxylase subunit
MATPFRRVLIANRGEIAVRIARTLREMGISPIAVYSDADRASLHVRHCDHAVHIGGAQASESYLLSDRILEAAAKTGADAIHPGYGFLSERADFVDAAEAAGVVFIGPSSAAMRVMGTKTTARAAMVKAGVPCVPGSAGALADGDEAAAQAQQMGYPVMLKAAAGGGGKGMRLVHEPAGIQAAWRMASSEAASAFGDASVYMEKALVEPRHIEVQIFANGHGDIWAVGERDCSMQRRHQKVIEETPAFRVPAATRAKMAQVACQAARAVNYVGAGTIEFLLDSDGSFYFLEMNTRLQVEHAVTEMCHAVDLVAAQVRVAMGERVMLTPSQLQACGHAMEARLYAEDPVRDFLPSPGRIMGLELPHGPGIRVDCGVPADGVVSPYYDPMIAKIIAWGEDREHARQRLMRALTETHVKGITTNKAFLLSLLEGDAYAAGNYHTGTVQPPSQAAVAAREPTGAALDAALVALVLARHRGQLAQNEVATAPAPALEWNHASWRLEGS